MSGYSSSYDRFPGGWNWPENLEPDIAPPPPTTEPSTSKSNDHQERPGQSAPPPAQERHWKPRTCRICLETVYPSFNAEPVNLPGIFQTGPSVTYDSEGGRLIRPCKCKGSSRYVHESCLQEWRHADPGYGRRNYWQCPTCHFQYRLERMQWGRWVRSQSTQVTLTLVIFLLAVFLLGFLADPIINLYFDPVSTLASLPLSGQDAFQEFHILDEIPDSTGWTEHFIKGLTSLGLMGFVKMFFTLGPWNWFNMRNQGMMGGRRGGTTGRERMNAFTWLVVITGVCTFIYTVWKGVRAWSRRVLEKAGERVMDVQGDDPDGEWEEEDQASNGAS